jgi:hypothetical protein
MSGRAWAGQRSKSARAAETTVFFIPENFKSLESFPRREPGSSIRTIRRRLES